MLLSNRWRALSLLILAVAPAFLAERPLHAQAMGFPITDRVPATIVLVDELDEAPQGAVILRRGDRHPNDVIVIARREATAELLSAAVFTLLIARHLLGDVPVAEARIPVLRATGPRAWRSRIVPRLQRLLEKLLAAEPAPVGDTGVFPSETLWLPADYRIRLSPTGAAGAARGKS